MLFLIKRGVYNPSTASEVDKTLWEKIINEKEAGQM
jgi:hypothetical protein